MYIDLHCHSKFTKKAKFSIKTFRKFIKIAKLNGYTAIALTEHFDTDDFEEIYEEIEKHYEYKHEYFDVNGFKVFSGMEVEIIGNAHIVLIGHKDNILKVRSMFPKHIEEKDFITLEELIKIGRENNLILIGAHPFSKTNPLYNYNEEIIKKPDAVELNGKRIKDKDKMFDFSKKLHMPITAGSDSHTFFQLGTVKNHFEKECITSREIKEEIIKNNYEIIISKHANLKNKISNKYKTLLKKWYKL